LRFAPSEAHHISPGQRRAIDAEAHGFGRERRNALDKFRPAIFQWSVVPCMKETYGRVVKSKKPAASRNSSPVAQAKPGRAQIRREEPRRAAPRATGNAPERGNQSRSHKSGRK